MKDWVITVVVAAFGAIASGAMIWGGTQSTIGNLKEDVHDIKAWKDDAIKQMGTMDAKLDLLLQVNGVEYRPRKMPAR